MPRAPRERDPDWGAPPDDEAPVDEALLDVPRWGLGDVALGFGVAQLAAAVVYIVVVAQTHYVTNAPSGVGGAIGEVTGRLATGQAPFVSEPVPLYLTVLLQLPLWAGLLLVPIWAAKTKGRGAVRDFGLRIEWSDVPIGLAVGAVCQLLVVPGLYWLLFKLIGTQDVSAVARQLTDRATSPLGIVALFLIVGVGAPIAEEVFFRGLMLKSFEKRGMSWHWAVIATAFLFAASHLQPLQFPALFLFGIVLGWLVHVKGRLGPAIMAHLAFNVVAAASLVWGLGWG